MVVTGLTSEPLPVGAGFFFQRCPIDTFVAFSTSPGEMAADGRAGENSPFTSSFVANARANPGAELNALMARTRRDVHEATAGRQLPWESSSLTEILALEDGCAHGLVLLPDLDLVDAPTGTPASVGGAQSRGDIVVKTRFEREIPLGARMAEHVGDQPSVMLTEPTGGTVSIVEGGRVRVLRAGDAISPGTLRSLVFQPEVPRVSSVGLESAARAEPDGMIQQAAPDDAIALLEVGVRLGDPMAAYTLGRDLLRYGETERARSRGHALLSRAHAAGHI